MAVTATVMAASSGTPGMQGVTVYRTLACLRVFLAASQSKSTDEALQSGFRYDER
jgi:hypothetical protein